jgi:hypothetical protein
MDPDHDPKPQIRDLQAITTNKKTIIRKPSKKPNNSEIT